MLRTTEFRYLKALPITIFLGAFLLFQVQPMIARFILPWFGGTPGVWTTALLFFQMMLLMGYIYTHLIASYLTVKRQVRVHLALLATTLLFLPIIPAEAWKPDTDARPTLQISLLLMATIGLPYLAVSSTAPLLQSWMSRTQPGKSPYRLYAFSNIGSFTGLLSYPFLIAPLIGLQSQMYAWSATYVLFVAMSAWTAKTVLAHTAPRPDTQDKPARRRIAFSATWLLQLALSATGVVVLLAATNQLCKDVAVVPLLWVLPLTLYLLSFVVTFGRPEWYIRPLWGAVMVLAIAAVIYLMLMEHTEGEFGFYLQVFVYSAVVFGCAMVCHGELYRLRPPAAHLTSFYLTLSLGGAIGGLLVNIVAPLLFQGYWEFHVSLAASIVLLAICALPDAKSKHPGLAAYGFSAALLPVLVASTFFLSSHIKSKQQESIATLRSFYGILRVNEFDAGTPDHRRALFHGRINHGGQHMNAALRKSPMTYYGPNSGLGIAMKTLRQHPTQGADLRIGAIGLGTASIATFTRASDSLRFYEINPDVTRLARQYFSYLSDATSQITITHGDGRISLERELKSNHANSFDILVIDAFSGDAIPVHLLTQEALALYRRHMSPDGLIAIHISNLFFDLRPVVRALARDADMKSVWFYDDASGPGEDPNDWMILTTNEPLYRALQARSGQSPTGDTPEPLWTDDYADVLSAVWKD